MMPLKRLWCILFIGICVTCHTSDHTISPTKGSDNNTRKAATSGVHKDLRSQPWPDQWDTYSQDYVIRLLTPKRKGGYLISWCNAVWSRLKDNGLDSVDTAIQITNAITTAKKKDGTNVLERTWNAYQQETQWTEYLQDMCSDQILARADAHKLNTLLSNLYYLNAPISEQFINAWQRHFQRYLSYRVSLDKKLDINLPRGLYLLSLFPEHVSSKLIDEWLMVSKPYLQRFAPRGLANSILSMARLQKHPPTSWLQEWTNCASASIENFNGQELANSIYAFARLNLVPYMDWLTSWLSCSYKKMHEFTTQGLTCAVYALAQLQIDPGTQWLERWTWQFYRNMEDCTPQALVNAMQALIQLQKTPTQEWLEKWQTCVYHHINNFIPHDFAISLWSLAKLETQPSDAWLQRWLIHSQSRMHEYNHQGLANSIWDLGPCHVRRTPQS